MSEAAFAPGELDRIERNLIVGLARAALSAPAVARDSENPTLTTLALIAQRKRFRRTASPPGLSTEPVVPTDSRPVLPNPARAVLMRLVAGRDAQSDVAARAAYDLLDAHAMRLHPFDLPKLSGYLRELARHRELGPAERGWLSRGVASSETAAPLAEPLSEENWTLYPKADRIGFLVGIRETDPDRARGLIEAVFEGEPAALRADMVGVLKRRVGDADIAFLEAALTDRAQSVKEAARTALSAMAGTDAYRERCEAALAAIEKKGGGLLKGAARLRFKVDGKPHPSQRILDVRSALDGVRTEDVAAHVELPLEKLANAASGDHALYCALLGNLASEHRWDLVLASCRAGEADWQTVLEAVESALTVLPRERRRSLVQDIMRSADMRTPLAVDALTALYDLTGGPLEANAADRLLAAAGWREAVKASVKADREEPGRSLLAAVSALMPDVRSQRFLDAIEPVPNEIRDRAVLFREFAAALGGPPPTA